MRNSAKKSGVFYRCINTEEINQKGWSDKFKKGSVYPEVERTINWTDNVIALIPNESTNPRLYYFVDKSQFKKVDAPLIDDTQEDIDAAKKMRNGKE